MNQCARSKYVSTRSLAASKLGSRDAKFPVTEENGSQVASAVEEEGSDVSTSTLGEADLGSRNGAPGSASVAGGPGAATL